MQASIHVDPHMALLDW